jgi:hypothetical protein
MGSRVLSNCLDEIEQKLAGIKERRLAPSKLRLSLFDKGLAALDGIRALADLGLCLDLAAKLGMVARVVATWSGSVSPIAELPCG